MKQFDIVTIGACIIDAFLTIHQANLHCRLNEKDCELCIKYGEKIQVDKCEFLLGGNACNVAVGLARLGFESGVMAEIGDDEFSQKIVNGLTKEGVNQKFLIQTKGAKSSFAIGIEFKRERTLFVSHAKRDHNFQFDNVEAGWIYLTSLGQRWEEAYQRTVEYVKAKNINLVFNPGSPQFKSGVESFFDVLKVADVLIVNKTEAEKIVNGKLKIVNREEKDMKNLITQLRSFGPRIVIITDGVNGSFATDGEKVYQLGVFPANIVAKTGAGDAYSTGFVGALMLGSSVQEAMRWGAINSSSVLTKVGAQEGLLTRYELEEKLRANPDFVARQL